MQAIADVMAPADIQVRAVPDARTPLWDKFVYLVPFSGFTGAARLPIGFLWQHPQMREMFYAAAREVAAIAAAEGVTLSADRFETLREYMDNIPPTTRSSLLIDLEQGKRIEVEALQGAALRRAAAHGVPAPIVATLYAVLKPWAVGQPSRMTIALRVDRRVYVSRRSRSPPRWREPWRVRLAACSASAAACSSCPCSSRASACRCRRRWPSA